VIDLASVPVEGAAYLAGMARGNKMRLWVIAVTALTLAPSLLAQDTAFSPSFRAQDDSMKLAYERVTLRIEIRRSVYSPGDSIDVRLTLRNPTDRMFILPAVPAPYLAKLRVTDAAGSIPPSMTLAPGVLALAVKTLKPGAELILTSARQSEWINLRDWGYDIRKPAKYTITGSPDSGNPNKDVRQAAAQTSAEVTFTVR
jgi:hypothetical protein